MNLEDLESTQLIQVGSRVTYRLGFAGPMQAIRELRARLEGQTQAGQRVEDVRDARPEVRSALERAEKFLGLSALLSVILAAVAIALAARRYLKRHLDGVAIMVIGIHTRDNDLVVNPVREKKLTNVRAAGKDENVVLTPPIQLTLESAIEFIADDELVEITPKSIRIRKRHLKEHDRKKASRTGA